MTRIGTILAALLLTVNATAKAPKTGKAQFQAPTSSMTRAEADFMGRAWKAINPDGRDFCDVKNTDSMLPIFDSNAVLLLERVNPADLEKKNIALFDYNGGTICHFVQATDRTGILFKGHNNQKPDGWIDPARVKWRVAGILYTCGY